MVKKKEDIVEKIVGVLFISLLGLLFLAFFVGIGQELIDVRLNQETADDICQQLTGNSTAVASDDYVRGISGGKLICTIPSYDSTQNIIVKSNDK